MKLPDRPTSPGAKPSPVKQAALHQQAVDDLATQLEDVDG
jgi:hypothetical protein